MGTNTESIDGSDREDESYEETARRWRNARMTTVILEKEDDGDWYATQRGVDIVGVARRRLTLQRSTADSSTRTSASRQG